MTDHVPLLEGSCLCGGVTYVIRGRLGEMGHCHCSMCRKAHGAAFGTYAPVSWELFEIRTGEHLISRYRSSEQVTRTFCSVCGSTLQYVPDGRPGFGLAIGTLDTDPGSRPVYQIWTRDKAPWWDLAEEPRSFETEPSAGETGVSAAPAFPKGVAQPAIRALASIGVQDLEALARHRKEDLVGLHGMGPKAMRLLEEALHATGLDFAD